MQAIQQIEAEVLVIDNCSGDNSIAYLSKQFTQVKFIANKKNEGFAKANNTALKQCTGEFVLFLNPDTIIPEDVLVNCLGFFHNHENAGALSIKMVDGSGNFLPESKRSFPSASVSFFKLCGLADLFPKSKLFNKYGLGFFSNNEVHEVDVLCGAFIMAKKNLLEKLNGFDEAFFMYGEDIDLCYRIQKEGFKIYYLGTETIIHFKGESARKGSLNYVRIFYQAMNVFVKKHYKGSNAGFMIFFLQAGIYLRAAISLAGTPFRFARKKLMNKVSNIIAPVLLAGDANSIDEAEIIIHKNRPDTLVKKIDLTVEQLLENLNTAEVILCTGKFSYKNAIDTVVNSKNIALFKWHGFHSASIVGSSDKKFTGVVYSLEE